MISIAIVDDDPRERRLIRECLDDVQERSGSSFQPTEYAAPEQFLMEYEPGRFDIVFMDIVFPGSMDGMTAARELRGLDDRVLLIFFTNMAQMALEGYRVDALDFIVKPLEKDAFFLKMTRALGRVATDAEKMISIRSDGRIIRLRKSLISHLDADGHSVVYYSREGVFTEYISLSGAKKKLNDAAFEPSDRSRLVNLRRISVIRKNICIVDGEEIPIARDRCGAFKKAFADYLSGLRH